MINSQMPVTQAVMYQAAKYAGIEKPCAFDSGGRVTFAMKLFELNLFVWILYCSWDHYTGYATCIKSEFKFSTRSHELLDKTNSFVV